MEKLLVKTCVAMHLNKNLQGYLRIKLKNDLTRNPGDATLPGFYIFLAAYKINICSHGKLQLINFIAHHHFSNLTAMFKTTSRSHQKATYQSIILVLIAALNA